MLWSMRNFKAGRNSETVIFTVHNGEVEHG